MEKITEELILDTLNTVSDPELRVGIVDLGLVYSIFVSEDNDIHVDMTLTSPGCPASGQITDDASAVLSEIDGASKITIEIVWDPPWNVNMMSDFAKDELGIP